MVPFKNVNMIDFIKSKIDYLLDFSKNTCASTFEEKFNKFKQQEDELNNIKILARRNNTMIGRVVRLGYVNHNNPKSAMYIIVDANKIKVKIKYVNHENWNDIPKNVLEREGTLDTSYALSQIYAEDIIDNNINALRLVTAESN